MPRKKRLRPRSFCSHFITARCHNREWFRLPLSEVWDIFSRYLHFIHHAYEVRALAFVLMGNHYHLLLMSRGITLAPAMGFLQREVAREINRQTGKINQVWGGRYDSQLIVTGRDLAAAYKYLYRNPVDAQICAKVENYEFSTMRGLLGLAHSVIPIVDPLFSIKTIEQNLEWLNTETLTSEDRETLRASIRWRQMTQSTGKVPGTSERVR